MIKWCQKVRAPQLAWQQESSGVSWQFASMGRPHYNTRRIAMTSGKRANAYDMCHTYRIALSLDFFPKR
jgi:hypothetical protein